MRTDKADVSSAALRTELLESLPTDSEFEMFCLDYFPFTQRQFSSGMDRTAKINLLLLREHTEQISAQLISFRARSARTPDSISSFAHPAPLARPSSWIGWIVWVLGSVVLCWLGAGAVIAIQGWQRNRQVRSTRVLYGYLLDIHTEQPVVDATVSVAAQSGASSRDEVVRSDSQGFFILERVRPIREGETIVIHSPSCRDTRGKVSFEDVISKNPWGQSVPQFQWPTLLFRVDCHGIP